MTLVPLPSDIAQTIADRAVQNARQDLRGRGWKSSGALQPYGGDGEVGITSTVKYLLIQNRGFDAFLMKWVEGRGPLPLSCKQGDGPHFRSAKRGVVGTPGMVDIPHKGKTWRSQRWRHPGLPRKAFLETAISKAVKESRKDIQEVVMNCLKGGRP